MGETEALDSSKLLFLFDTLFSRLSEIQHVINDLQKNSPKF